MFRTSRGTPWDRRSMFAREAEDKELGMADSVCMLTAFVAWWYIVQRKPGIDKALQEVCGNEGSGLQNYLNS